MRSRPGTLHLTHRNMQGSKLSRLPYVVGIFLMCMLQLFLYPFVTVYNLKLFKSKYAFVIITENKDLSFFLASSKSKMQ